MRWRDGGRLHIAVRGISEPRASALARAVEAEMQRHPAVSWAAVNAPLGVVVVACPGGPAPVDDLVGIVDRLELDHAARSERPSARPALMDRVPGAVASLAASAAGLSLAGAGRALRMVRLPAALGSLVQVVDTQPRLRGVVERAVGPDRADLLIAAGNAAAQSAAQGVGGLALDVGHRVLQVAEAVMQRDAWARSEPSMCGDHSRARAAPVTPERPLPLASGPVERHSEHMGIGAAAVFGGVLAATGSPPRAAGVALAGLPKAARLGREGFATSFGCVLARRGVVVTDHRVLRRLDRVDSVVLDADVLTTGGLVVDEIVALDRADVATAAAAVSALFAADQVGETRTDGRFVLGPLHQLGPLGQAGTKAVATLTGHGTVAVLGLAEDGMLLAVVAVAAERAPGADLLLAAARRADAEFLLAASAADAAGLAGHGADRVLADGRRLVASIRNLQAAGKGVLVVSRQRRALAAADCGVGLSSRDGRPAWGGHILAGDDLAAAALVVDGVRVARGASRQSVALSRAGTGLGAVLAVGSAVPGAAARSLMAVNGAAAIALASGAWSATELARRPVAAPPPRPPWHAMPGDLVLDQLRSQPTGLTSADARQRWQPDDRWPKERSLARAFASELANPLTPILLGGAVLSASIGAVTDAAIVSGVCGASALMGAVQRVYTDRAMARLFQMSAVTARVLRDGREQLIPAAGLVVGDVVLLASDDVVPADCRLLEARALAVDESSLTGESLPVGKAAEPVVADAIADRRSMLYEGSSVAAGEGRAVVVASGSATEVGQSLAGLPEAAPATGVEGRLAKITSTTLPLALGSAGAVVAAGLLRGRRARDSIGAAVGLAVASVPEGLPFLVTAAQLAAGRRLAGRGALVRNPRTIEGLGRADVLCFDKTGTLTRGQLAVSVVSDGVAVRRADRACGSGSHRDVLAAALRATPRPDGNGILQDMTDAAIIGYADEQKVTRSDSYPHWRQADALPFEPSRRYHATLASTANGPLLSVKGAPEIILPRCTWSRGRAIGARERSRLSAGLGALARNGYRVLAVAESKVGADYRLSDQLAELSFAGFLAFGDPVRATAGASVRDLREAGVHIVMITGDHPATAMAIATELDVLNGGSVLTGPDLDRLDDTELPKALADATVIARCTPAHKVRMVRAYQTAGRVVAMTGDGANDAAAIRLADVGIALGRRGTPAARAAADLIVTDDRLETILSAVVEGRAMWRSVRQAIGILVGGNIGEIGYTLFGALLTGASPLTARQLLLVNLLTDLAPAVAIAIRAPAPEAVGPLLAEGPDVSLGSALTEEIAVRAIATGAAASGAWLVARLTGRAARARTVGLAALVGTELGQTLLVGGRNPAVAAAGLASTGLLVAVVQTPAVSQFFGCTPIGPVGWTIAASSALACTAGSLLLPPIGRSLAGPDSSLAASPAAANARALLIEMRERATRGGSMPPPEGRAGEPSGTAGLDPDLERA